MCGRSHGRKGCEEGGDLRKVETRVEVDSTSVFVDGEEVVVGGLCLSGEGVQHPTCRGC